MADKLFALRTNYYLGNYKQAISEGYSVPSGDPTDPMEIEKNCLMFRSQIALGNYGIVLSEVHDSAPVALQSVKLLATYLASDDNREIALMTLKEWLSDPASASNPTLAVIGATVYLHERDLEQALKCVFLGSTLEMLAMTVHCFIKLDRLELAEKQLKIMQSVDDDATLTQLSDAWLKMSRGDPQTAQQAYYIYQEFCEKYDSSPVVLNGQAAALMQLGKFEEAEPLLLEALGKSSNDATTLANLVTCMTQLRKPQEQVSRYLNQLKMSQPKDPFVAQHTQMESSFERAAASFAI